MALTDLVGRIAWVCILRCCELIISRPGENRCKPVTGQRTAFVERQATVSEARLTLLLIVKLQLWRMLIAQWLTRTQCGFDAAGGRSLASLIAFIICPIAMHSMGQIIKSLASVCLSVCVCVCVCRHSYGRNFESILMKLCTVVWGMKTKIEFVGG